MKLQRILRNTYENSSGHAHSRLVSYPRRSIIAKGLGYSARPRQRNFLQFRKHLGNPDEILKHAEDINFSGDELNDLSIKAGLQSLPVKPNHCIELKSLVYSEDAPQRHKDPFDRILICQAKVEGMKLMTHDTLIPYYNESCVLSV